MAEISHNEGGNLQEPIEQELPQLLQDAMKYVEESQIPWAAMVYTFGLFHKEGEAVYLSGVTDWMMVQSVRLTLASFAGSPRNSGFTVDPRLHPTSSGYPNLNKIYKSTYNLYRSEKTGYLMVVSMPSGHQWEYKLITSLRDSNDVEVPTIWIPTIKDTRDRKNKLGNTIEVSLQNGKIKDLRGSLQEVFALQNSVTPVNIIVVVTQDVLPHIQAKTRLYNEILTSGGMFITIPIERDKFIAECATQLSDAGYIVNNSK